MSTAAPRLLSLATAVPDQILHQAEVAGAARAVFEDELAHFQHLLPVYANTGIETRHACLPLQWYQAPHDFDERNKLNIRHAVQLLERVAAEALESAGLDVAEIDLIVTVSSTGIATPTLDALLLERLSFRRDVQRLPIFGLGCAGGALGLGRAAAMARSAPASKVLLLVVELCSLTFRSHDATKSNVVATALFGDGAAAAVVGCAGDGPRLTAWGEHTWPGTLDVMGWQVDNDGLAVVFSRDIPDIVRRDFGPALACFLNSQGLSLADVDTFVPHPGGIKVLDALEAVFELPPGGLEMARQVLRRYGNMSSASVLFVLRQTLQQCGPAGRSLGRTLISSLGPGFTAGFALLEDCGI